jgi:hypothetical protein
VAKKVIYKDRFWIEDEQFVSPEYFSALIENDTVESWLSKFREMPWCQVDIGGTGHEGMSWGFCLKDQHDVRQAIYRFLALRDAFDRLTEKLSEFLDLG